ncbi:MAG: transketolase [bacterium]|nr:transketolase [bacterium]
MANRLRWHSLVATSEAGSGHPTSCMSCAELIATLFFEYLRFDVKNPRNLANDRFILSKGHAAPILWAAWAEAGAFPIERLLGLRKADSDLEGHPTPRMPWVDVATGSLGQGLSDGVGMALAARLDGRPSRTYVLLGDGEIAEGNIWEAAQIAAFRRLDNLTAIVDANRLGQSGPTMYGHELVVYEGRFQAFGWHTQAIDGHSIDQIAGALERALDVRGQPTVIIARTLKGKGVSFLEDKEGWHGKPVKKGPDLDKALAEIGGHMELEEKPTVKAPRETTGATTRQPMIPAGKMAPPEYTAEMRVATREAYGAALAKLGEVSQAVVALDGDVKNSTYSERFAGAHPERFIDCFIAEQNMIGMAMGLAAMGRIPFVSTFACFLTRAFDQLRMAGVSELGIKVAGSHAGVSIGEDGPSQMGLEDLAMMRAIHGATVLYPSDAVSGERMVELAAATPGVVYIRTTRPKTPILYTRDEEFRVGGSKVLRSSGDDRVTLIGAGITLHEALKAAEQLRADGIAARVIDCYSIQPLDRETIESAARETGAIVTVEDHYPAGGLGEAVAGLLGRGGFACRFRSLAVHGLPHSADLEALMDEFGIDGRAIATAARELAR